jgi:hypothetical protein
MNLNKPYVKIQLCFLPPVLDPFSDIIDFSRPILDVFRNRELYAREWYINPSFDPETFIRRFIKLGIHATIISSLDRL